MYALATVLANVSKPPDGFAPPGTEIFDYTKDCLVGSGDYCITKISFWMLMSAVIIGAIFIIAFRKPSLVPRGIQNAVESLVELIRNSIVMEVMGPDGLPFLPFLTSLFVFIWLNNTYGIIPGIQIPTTSRMAIPAALALFGFVLSFIIK